MTLKVQVVSPERILWTGDAEMVTARTVDGGDIAFLTGHAPFVGALDIGKVIVRPAEGNDVFFAVHGGFVEVSDSTVSLLTDVAETTELVDIERANKARDGAMAAIAQDPDDAEAVAALKRAELRLEVAGIVPP